MAKQLDTAPGAGTKAWRKSRDAPRRIWLQIVCVLVVVGAMSLVGCEAGGLGLSLRDTLIVVAIVVSPTLVIAARRLARRPSTVLELVVSEPIARETAPMHDMAEYPLGAPIITADSEASYADAVAVLEENIADFDRWFNEGGNVGRRVDE
jgi:hypothetical protein